MNDFYRNGSVHESEKSDPVRICLDGLLPTVFVAGRHFYICGQCGKVYWDGSHLNNYRDSYGLKLINKHGDDESVREE